jgi:uncharacterized membrane protein YdbT with pleckstrin-like domain
MPAAVAPGPEETLWTGAPSFRLLTGRLLGALIALLLIPSIAAFLVSLLFQYAEKTPAVAQNRSPIILVACVVAFVALLPMLVGLVRAIIHVKSLKYTLTNQRLLVEKGLLSRALQEVDLRYVDETQFSQDFVERMLGIGSVRIASSDAMNPRLVLVGLRDPRGVRETLRAAAYQVSQRQFFTRST